MNGSVSNQTVVVVLGMHRSGTSAITRVINLLGVELGADLLPPDVDNPTGFWENRKIFEIHKKIHETLGTWYDDIAFPPERWWEKDEIASLKKDLKDIVQGDFSNSRLWGFKDPRACRLIPLWREIFNESGCEAKYIIITRHPYEVARSLEIRDGFSINKSILLSLEHLLEAEVYTRNNPRVVITYDRLLADWRETVMRIASRLEIEWPVKPIQAALDIENFLDPSMRHCRADKLPDGYTERGDRTLAKWVNETFSIFLQASSSASLLDEKRLDQISSQLKSEIHRFLV